MSPTQIEANVSHEPSVCIAEGCQAFLEFPASPKEQLSPPTTDSQAFGLRMKILSLILSTYVVTQHVQALCLTMVASGSSRGPLGNMDIPQPVSVTSGLISQLAILALKRRLAKQAGVKCDVTVSSSDLLLRGRVGPVTVKGRGWHSSLGLSCRAIEATVETCELDSGRILQSQKLVLNSPAKGKAMIALNEADFGNFVTHPMMKPPGLPGNNSTREGFKFISGEVKIDTSNGGAVIFFGSYLDELWRLRLTRGGEGKRAIIEVSPETLNTGLDYDVASKDLTELISAFFNEMVFELDGTFLTFNDMMVTAKGDSPSLMLALSIVVHKFPSPGLSF